jgi:hypothetical protein
MSSSAISQWFEIGVLDYSHARLRKTTYVPPGESDVVMNEQYGLSYIPPMRKSKGKIDVTTGIPMRVIFRRAKTHKVAMRMAERIGTVLFCHKVDASYKMQKMEYIELNQKPMTVEIAVEDQYILNAKGELTATQQGAKGMLEQKYEVQVDLTR